MRKMLAVLTGALVLAAAAIATVTDLATDAAHSREAQVKLARAEVDVNALQGYPWEGNPADGKSPAAARSKMDAARRAVVRSLAELRTEMPVAELERVAAPLAANWRDLRRIHALVAESRMIDAGQVAYGSNGHLREATAALHAAGRAYDARAATAQNRAIVGSAAVIVVLLSAFGFFFHRSTRARAAAERLARENETLLAATRVEAHTDALTGLPNRRALLRDLEAGIPAAGGGRQLLLALFDLDGFKQYNDSFGHPAGDDLLARLGARLATTMEGLGSAYRMGGDEFCVLADVDDGDTMGLAALAGAALSEKGEGFLIGCSYGVALVPREAQSVEEALGLADQRMYGRKGGNRQPASRESADVLLTVLSERDGALGNHVGDVSRLARSTAERLGLDNGEVHRIATAAALHDVGKVAIPDAILNKSGPLDPEEWLFMRRHTVIGERVVRAAPSLAHAADLVRASHEWVDGSGYPDGLQGDEIPLGARIISVCDAFDAMTAERPYRRAKSVDGALTELRRCAGSQFDAGVVEAFVALVEEARGEPAEGLPRAHLTPGVAPTDTPVGARGRSPRA